MMENLLIKDISYSNKINFIRIGDLSYFEGPLLTVFEDANTGQIYLFDWVDGNNTANRWLIYRVTPKALLDFINNRISHLELFNSCPDKKFYFTDIDNKTRNFEYQINQLTEVPLAYYPNKENYFEIEDCNSLNKIQALIIKSISRKKQENEYSIDISSLSRINHKHFKTFRFNRLSYLGVEVLITNSNHIRNFTLKSNKPENYYHYSLTNLHLKSNVNLSTSKQKKICLI